MICSRHVRVHRRRKGGGCFKLHKRCLTQTKSEKARSYRGASNYKDTHESHGAIGKRPRPKISDEESVVKRCLQLERAHMHCTPAQPCSCILTPGHSHNRLNSLFACTAILYSLLRSAELCAWLTSTDESSIFCAVLDKMFQEGNFLNFNKRLTESTRAGHLRYFWI